MRWNGKLSEAFRLGNGVKQGGVISPLLYCFYSNGLFEILRRKKTGCWNNGHYLGALSYADDNLLMCPSREGLQEMLKTCQDYAESHNLKFSTNPIPSKNKTKCLNFQKNEKEVNEHAVYLCENPLPWIHSAKHLGNTIENNLNGMAKDTKLKRAIFIQKNNKISQEFHFAGPVTKFSINLVYNTDFTGSSLWDLFSSESESLYKTWNISVRLLFDIPRTSHCYFVEPLTEKQHIKFSLMKRFFKFCESLRKSSKGILRMMISECEKNTRTVTGNNLREIMLLCKRTDILELEVGNIMDLKYREPPTGDEWKILAVKELIEVRENEDMFIENFSSQDITEMINILCVS